LKKVKRNRNKYFLKEHAEDEFLIVVFSKGGHGISESKAKIHIIEDTCTFREFKTLQTDSRCCVKQDIFCQKIKINISLKSSVFDP
jgi:hypothetical protein